MDSCYNLIEGLTDLCRDTYAEQKCPECKKVQGQSEPALWMGIYVTKIFDINWGQELIYQ